jgi:hypothetical protein
MEEYEIKRGGKAGDTITRLNLNKYGQLIIVDIVNKYAICAICLNTIKNLNGALH